MIHQLEPLNYSYIYFKFYTFTNGHYDDSLLMDVTMTLEKIAQICAKMRHDDHDRSMNHDIKDSSKLNENDIKFSPFRFDKSMFQNFLLT